MKLTKRKGFNFFRSYYDVYNELSVKGKIAFMDALLDRQFLGVKPEGLKGMAKFAYISQTNSIDSQVKGYEDKTKTRLDGSEYFKDGSTPIVPPCYGGEVPPTGQEEEKGKEEEQYVYTKENFLENWNQLRSHYLKTPSNLNKLYREESDSFNDLENDTTKEQYHKALHGLFKQEKVPADVMWFRPKHFLNNIDTYLDAELNKKYNLYV